MCGITATPRLSNHPFEHRRLRDRTVVEVEGGWDALQGIALARLGRHGVEQKFEGRLDLLAINAAVFLIGHARTVIDDGKQHQDRRTLALRIDPRRRLQLLQIRRAHVEVPERVRMLRLEANRRRFADHALVIIAKPAQMPVEGGGGDTVLVELDEPIRGVDPVFLQQFQNPHRRQMAAFSVGRPDLHRGDDCAQPLDLVGRQVARSASVGTVRFLRAAAFAQQSIERGAADRIKLRRCLHQPPALGGPRRQGGQAAAQAGQRLDRHGTRRGRHWCQPLVGLQGAAGHIRKYW
jgi:hypothetical protein